MEKLAPLAAACALTLGAAACSPPQTWQVVGISTDPGLPSSLPADAAGAANFRLRGDRLKGATPCATVDAKASLDDATLTLESVELGPTDDACTGGARHTHDQLAQLLTPGASFQIRETGPTERLLVLSTDNDDTDNAASLNPPSVRVMSL